MDIISCPLVFTDHSEERNTSIIKVKNCLVAWPCWWTITSLQNIRNYVLIDVA